MACPYDKNIKEKQCEKLTKYQQIISIWNMWKKIWLL
jgi:hypothetical protein